MHLKMPKLMHIDQVQAVLKLDPNDYFKHIAVVIFWNNNISLHNS